MNGKLRLKDLLPDNGNGNSIVIGFMYGLKAIDITGGVVWLCHDSQKGHVWCDDCKNRVVMSLRRAKVLADHYMKLGVFGGVDIVQSPNYDREFNTIAFRDNWSIRPFREMTRQLKLVIKILRSNDWGNYDLKESHLWGQIGGLLYSLGYGQDDIQDFSYSDTPREGKRSVKQIKWYIEFLLEELIRDGEDPNITQEYYGRIDGMLFALGHNRGAAMGLREELIERFCYHVD